MRRERRRYERDMNSKKTKKQGERWERTVLWCKGKTDEELKIAMTTKSLIKYPHYTLSLEKYKNYIDNPSREEANYGQCKYPIGYFFSNQNASNTDINAIEWYLKSKDIPNLENFPSNPEKRFKNIIEEKLLWGDCSTQVKPINPEDDAC